MPAAHVAHAKGVSRQCAHRWLARFDAEGLAGLHDRPSRPHRSPKRTCAEVEDRVVAARLAARRGPDRLGPELGSQRVIQRAHRVEGLTIPNPREPKFAQEPYEVAFGDSQLNVLTIIRLLPPNQCVGVVVKPICVPANAPNAGMIYPSPEVCRGRDVRASCHHMLRDFGSFPSKVHKEPTERLLRRGLSCV